MHWFDVFKIEIAKLLEELEEEFEISNDGTIDDTSSKNENRKKYQL